ncbi:MAG: hypothetical protein NTY15_18745 [Planctomycetota bacterium]|nr:hypothetical protein [Planctomycetota bacterium]
MPIQKRTWHETCKESSIPLFLSTIVHTSIILVLALTIAVEDKTTRSTLSATFAGQPTDVEELCTIDFANSKLAVSDEPAPYGVQEDMIALEQVALSEIELSSQLKAVVNAVEAPKTARIDLGSNPPTRRSKVTQVSTSTAVASANQKSLSFGKKNAVGTRQIVPGPAATLEVIVPGLDPLGTGVLSQASNLSLTGGAMMVSTAWPAPAMAGTPLRFSYDASQADGRRLVVVAGTQTVSLPIYDWELLPLAKFVDSGHNGAVSIHMLGNHEKVSLDAAFEQTLLGLRFIQADMMPRGIIMSQEFLPQDENGVIVGPGEEERLSTDEQVESAVRELKPLMAKTRNGAPFSVLTDASIRFVFAIEGAEMVITGTPYFFFWEPANKGDQVIPRKALNDALKKAWPQIKQANPLVIESMERSFRTVALFRYQKQKSLDNWRSFVQQVSKVKLVPVATPAVLTN